MRVCGKSFETGEVVTLTLADGRIAGARVGAEEGILGGPDVWLSPGLLDLQVNGYGGCNFNVGSLGDPAEVAGTLAPVFDSAARAGTALLCPTITTNSREAILDGLTALSRALESDRQM